MAAHTDLHLVPNGHYQHPQHAAMGPHKHDHWFFSCHGVPGMKLLDARIGRFEGLDGRDDELCPASYVKVTCVIAIRGHRIFRRVKNVQRVRGGVPTPVPRHKVVRCIADAMFAFLNQAQPTDDHDWTFTFGPGCIEMEHLYLFEVRRYNKTLIPVFGYRSPNAGPAVMPEINAWINNPPAVV